MANCTGCGSEIIHQGSGPAPNTCGAPVCNRDARAQQRRQAPVSKSASSERLAEDRAEVVDLRQRNR